jgi:hypothetical protein
MLSKFANSSFAFALSLLVLVAVFGLPAWIALIRKTPVQSAGYRFGLYLISAGQIIQAGFILGAGMDLFGFTTRGKSHSSGYRSAWLEAASCWLRDRPARTLRTRHASLQRVLLY